MATGQEAFCKGDFFKTDSCKFLTIKPSYVPPLGSIFGLSIGLTKTFSERTTSRLALLCYRYCLLLFREERPFCCPCVACSFGRLDSSQPYGRCRKPLQMASSPTAICGDAVTAPTKQRPFPMASYQRSPP